jgi:hypothetical protein
MSVAGMAFVDQGLEDLLSYFAHSEIADSSHPVCPTTSQSTVHKTLYTFVKDPGDYPARGVHSQTNSSSTKPTFHGPMKFLELTRRTDFARIAA